MRPSRRRFLRGMLGGSAVAVGLPALDCWLDDNGAAWADGSALPRRFGLYFWGNGMIPDQWIPTQTGADWVPTAPQASLAAIRHKVTLITGTALRVANRTVHFSGTAGILTGLPEIVDGPDWTVAGPSVDQVIAAAVGGSTVFRSIEFGAAPDRGLSFLGPNLVSEALSNPIALYQRIFGDSFVAPGDKPLQDPSLDVRRSVLDAVQDDVADLRRRVGRADNVRLEQHLDGIRELENRLALLQQAQPSLEACERPAFPTGGFPDIDGRPQLSALHRAMVDLVAMALACDQTRVFSDTFTYPQSNNLFPDAYDGHHRLTHDEPGDQPQVAAITERCVAEYAYLLQALDAIPEGDGTLLDHCAVLGTSEVSLGHTHSLEEFPLLVGGGQHGSLLMGHHLRSYDAANSNEVVLSLIRSMGVPRADWGEGETRVEDGFSALELG